MNNTDWKVATEDTSLMLCDGCLARLEQWLGAETTPDEFLGCLLIFSDEPNLERFFCPRCTEKLSQLRASLLSQAVPKSR
jgi:hypothetical protein